jgi:hypothetical protein
VFGTVRRTLNAKPRKYNILQNYDGPASTNSTEIWALTTASVEMLLFAYVERIDRHFRTLHLRPRMIYMVPAG